MTNLGEYKIETAPELYRLVKTADDENRYEAAAELPGYVYPDEVLTIAAHRLAKYGQAVRVRAEDAAFIRALDNQELEGKSIFGFGFLLSPCAAAERAAVTKWTLSDHERELVQALGRREP